MEIKKVTDAAFKKYGRVISHVDVAELVAVLKETPIPADVVYEPSVESLEKLPVKEELSSVIYGEMPIQIGYCNGHNKKLNALEYHRDSEINIAAEDAVLMLGSLQDVEADFTYDTSKVEAFLVPAGTAVEIYALCTLPCRGRWLPGSGCSSEGHQLRVKNNPCQGRKRQGSQRRCPACGSQQVVDRPCGRRTSRRLFLRS